MLKQSKNPHTQALFGKKNNFERLSGTPNLSIIFYMLLKNPEEENNKEISWLVDLLMFLKGAYQQGDLMAPWSPHLPLMHVLNHAE